MQIEELIFFKKYKPGEEFEWSDFVEPSSWVQHSFPTSVLPHLAH